MLLQELQMQHPIHGLTVLYVLRCMLCEPRARLFLQDNEVDIFGCRSIKWLDDSDAPVPLFCNVVVSIHPFSVTPITHLLLTTVVTLSLTGRPSFQQEEYGTHH